MLGGDVIKGQIEAGVARRRVGLVIPKGAPARSHSMIVDGDGKEIGEVTSGAFSPTLQQNIAMGYVDKPFAKAGTEVNVVVRGKVGETSEGPSAPPSRAAACEVATGAHQNNGDANKHARACP